MSGSRETQALRDEIEENAHANSAQVRQSQAREIRPISPLLLEPPPQIQRPKRSRLQDVKIGGPSDLFAPSHWRRRQNACVRTKFCPRGPLGMPVPPPADPPIGQFTTAGDTENQRGHSMPNAWSQAAEYGWDGQPYIVVGVMDNHHTIPRERLVPVTKPGTLFKQIRVACRHVRPLFRRILSLKHVAGFGLYECHPDKGYHIRVELDRQTERILSEMFLDYYSGEPDYGDRWLHWVQKELNLGYDNPANGRYALQLLFRWSPAKIVLYGSTSIIFSLVIGFWYQWQGGQFPGAAESDMVAIVQTAWTIASYIVTAAGVAIALLAAITQIGDVA